MLENKHYMQWAWHQTLHMYSTSSYSDWICCTYYTADLPSTCIKKQEAQDTYTPVPSPKHAVVSITPTGPTTLEGVAREVPDIRRLQTAPIPTPRL